LEAVLVGFENRGREAGRLACVVSATIALLTLS